MRRAVLALILSLIATPVLASSFDRTPVLLVPGYGGAGAGFVNMVAYLVAHGYPSQLVRAIDLVPGDGANRPAAELQVAPAVETFLSDVNTYLAGQGYGGPAKTKVAILGWSMGAVSSRWYATKVAPERVERWIGLAGANHGSQCACDLSCPIPPPVSEPNGLEDLCPPFATDPGALVQLGLNGAPGGGVDETPYGFGADASATASVVPDAARAILYFAIQASNETYVTPSSSAEIDGAGGTSVTLPPGSPAQQTSPGNFLVPGTDHISIGLTSTNAFALVQALLEAPLPTPACGDGIRTVGELCDEGPANGSVGSCCTDSCTPRAAGAECRTSSGACDPAEQCDGVGAACPADVVSPDTDGDTVCDDLDPCTNSAGAQTFRPGRPGARLTLSKINDTGVGNDGLSLSATFDLAPSRAFAEIDPVARGARLIVRDAAGEVVADRVLPAAAYQGKGSAGWRRNASGTVWQYLDTQPIPLSEVRKVKLVDRSRNAPRRVQLTLVAARASYPVQPGDEPVNAVIVLGDATDSAAGRCGESAFGAGNCTFNGPGTTLGCRR